MDTRCRQYREISNIFRTLQGGMKYCRSRQVRHYFQCTECLKMSPNSILMRDLQKRLLSTIWYHPRYHSFYLFITFLKSVIFVRLYLDKHVINCVTFFLTVREEMKKNRKLRPGINCEEQVRSLLLSVGRLRQRQIAAISSALIFGSHPWTRGNHGLRWTIVKTVIKMTTYLTSFGCVSPRT